MSGTISAKVSVNFVFNHRKNSAYPSAVHWLGVTHRIKSVDLHHTYKMGNTLFHVFCTTADCGFLKLVLNTEDLSWVLEEAEDA